MVKKVFQKNILATSKKFLLIHVIGGGMLYNVPISFLSNHCFRMIGPKCVL